MPQQNHTSSTRWLIASAAVIIHLSIGSVYAWSVFIRPLQATHGWAKPELTWAFSVCIFLAGIASAFGGSWVERIGPRKSTMIAGVCFGLGVAGAGLADIIGSLPLLYAAYGVTGGIGLGIAYIAPISTVLKWFPDRPGLAIGLAVFGFGAGSLITGPVAVRIIESADASTAFFVLGAAYLTFIVAASFLLRFPPEGYRPAGWNPEGGKSSSSSRRNYELREAIRTPQFWLLWLLFFINISAGIMLISLASPMAQETVGLTAAQAAVMVGIMGIFNGAGRIFWSTISDYIGRVATFTTMFVVQIALFWVLGSITSALLFQIAFFLILTCYGGGFATCPAFTSDLFGAKRAGAIYGVVLTAWSIAGVAGPQLGAHIRELTGSYAGALHVITGGLVIALACTVMIGFLLRRIIAKEAAA